MTISAGLKNINMLTKEQFNSVTSPATNELYAVSGSGFGKPSSKYQDLTLGSSGTQYTAPGNGWVFLRMNATSASIAYCELQGVGIMSISNCYTSGHVAEVYIPVAKGSTFRTYYSNTTVSKFTFYYDEGE